MEILIAKSAGFCFGVKRAMNIASSCAEDECGDKGEQNSKPGDIYTLGPLIHNPQVVKRLEDDSNIHVKKTIDEMDSGTMIIRSHGVKSEDYEAATVKGLTVVDATCPFVKKTRDHVSELTEEGYTVVVVGDREHPEVQGIVSYGTDDVLVAASIKDLEKLPRKKKIGIVAQTTQSVERLQEIASFCMTRAGEVKVINTICNATSIRQEESVELSRMADCVIVVGGKNSANTKRLAEICRSIQPKTHHIEVAAEIEPEWICGVKRLGITAGASTPDWIIKNVIEKVEGFNAAEAG